MHFPLAGSPREFSGPAPAGGHISPLGSPLGGCKVSSACLSPTPPISGSKKKVQILALSPPHGGPHGEFPPSQWRTVSALVLSSLLLQSKCHRFSPRDPWHNSSAGSSNSQNTTSPPRGLLSAFCTGTHQTATTPNSPLLRNSLQYPASAFISMR